jgi:fucose permease
LRRDRSTLTLYALLGAWGYFLYGFGPVVSLLRDEQHISRGVASLHSTAFAAGAVIGGILTPRLVRRYGRPATIWWGTAAVCLAVVALCAFRALPLTVASAFAVAVAGTTLLSGLISGLSDHHGDAAPAAISEANAAACAAGAMAPLLIGASVGAGWTWRPGLALVIVLFGLLILATVVWRVRLPVVAAHEAAPTKAVVLEAASVEVDPASVVVPRTSRLSRAYWLAFTVISLCGSVEMCVNLWAADLLRSRAGMTPADAAASVAAVVGGMFLGRAFGGRLALRYRTTDLLLAALGLSGGGFGVFWLATSPGVAVAGLILIGLGNALHFPLGISLALRASDGRPDLAASRASYAMAIAFGVAPFLLGVVADATSVRVAFLLVPALLAAAALTVRRLNRELARTASDPGGQPGWPQVEDRDSQLTEQVPQ